MLNERKNTVADKLKKLTSGLRGGQCLWLGLYLLILLDGGGFNPHTVYFVISLSLFYIIILIRDKGFLIIEKRQNVFWLILILLGGMLSVFAGIDRGESIYGFIRLTAILITGTAVAQMEDRKKVLLLKSLSVIGVMLMTGCLLHKYAFFKEWVSVSGRMNGSFQYSNTMALFLLLGIVSAEHLLGRGKRILQIVLALGVLGTGSRTAFVMLCGYLLFSLVKYKGRNKYVLLAFMGALGAIWAITESGGNLYSAGRFLKLSTNASTFQGRLLYWEDAVRMFLKHPFGLGYMGYFYLQQVEQTGVYSVRFVHNEWLQWVLDYGIVAGIGLVGYLFGKWRQSTISAFGKEMLYLIAIYSFFDFHLQFFSIILIVLLLIPRGDVVWQCERSGKKKGIWYGLLIGAGISVCLLLSVVAAECYAKTENYGQAIKWNPFSAEYKQEYLLASDNLDVADRYACDLLKENQYLYPAYLIRSNAAAQRGELVNFVENRKQVLRLRKYKMREYEDYFQILFGWYMQAREEKNVSEMKKCMDEMKAIQEMMEDTKKHTSIRAYRIQEKPDLMLDKEYVDLMEKLEGESK